MIDGQVANSGEAGGWVLYEGALSSLNDPNAPPGDSVPLFLSSDGRLAGGLYEDANGGVHGYVATLSK